MPFPLAARRGRLGRAGEKEIVFDCTFDVPHQRGSAAPLQQGRCTTPAGETVALTVNDEQGARANGLRIFAGLRADPFFIDLAALLDTFKNARLAFKNPGTNIANGWNVLSVVVEIDNAMLLRGGRGPLFAIVCETVAAGKLPIRLERVRRPEVKNVIMGSKNYDTVNRDLEIRDLYNLEDAFHMGKDYRGAYRARLNANLAFFDSLDGKTDWPMDAQGAHPLTELLLADHLIVDISKPYTGESFFEIEGSMIQGRAHITCGGRSLNDDVMDTLYTLLINAGRGPRISDHVDQATVSASRTFPYLAPPTRDK